MPYIKRVSTLTYLNTGLHNHHMRDIIIYVIYTRKETSVAKVVSVSALPYVCESYVDTV